MPDLVVLDGHTINPGDNPWDPVRQHGDLTVYERTPDDKIVDRARGADVLLTNKTPLTEPIFDELEALEFIAELATGFDNIDVEVAAERGIPVSNVPAYSAASVAEHAVGLLLEMTHRIGEHDRAVHAGEWENSPDFSFWNQSLTELADKTLGVVGWGSIGSRVGRAAHALGMEVLGSTRSSRPTADLERFEWVDNDELFERSDAVSLHCPLTAETRQLVDADRLGEMKDSAYLINTGRGELLDEAAVARALEAEHLAGAAVDVVSEEPITSDNPLLEAPNCVITPHIAWTSLEARQRLMETTARNIEAYLEGEPQNVVNGVAA